MFCFGSARSGVVSRFMFVLVLEDLLCVVGFNFCLWMYSPCGSG